MARRRKRVAEAEYEELTGEIIRAPDAMPVGFGATDPTGEVAVPTTATAPTTVSSVWAQLHIPSVLLGFAGGIVTATIAAHVMRPVRRRR